MSTCTAVNSQFSNYLFTASWCISMRYLRVSFRNGCNKATIVLITVCLSSLLLFFAMEDLQPFSSPLEALELELLGKKGVNYATFTKPVKVVIGMVSCGVGKSREKYNSEAISLIKSVLISAEIYNVPMVEFHHFVEFSKDGKMFRQKLKEMGMWTVEVNFRVHLVKDVKMPKEFTRRVIYDERFRCSYIRYYFPSALPDVDALIYMDSDSLVTGNLMELWNQFSKMKNSSQMFGAVRQREDNNNKFHSRDRWSLHGIPHLTKRGFNSGILWMNLTKMREFEMEEMFTRVYKDYSKITGDKPFVDQKVLIVLTYLNPGLVSIVPCNFNFGLCHCISGLYCNASLDDPLGIHVVHGYNDNFQPNKTLHGVFKYYRDVDLVSGRKSLTMFKEKLMRPIREWYNVSNLNTKRTSHTGKCQGTLAKLLFPNFF